MPYQVEVCGQQHYSGDKTGDTLGGAIIGGILGNQVAVQYIKQFDQVFHNDEDKSLVEIEMNRLHVLLPKVAVYDSDSDDE